MKNILLVEDDEVMAALEMEFLKNEGYHIEHRNSGEAALELIQSEHDPIDLILMDIDLGNGMDGTQTAEKILDNQEIPILFLSSHTEKEVVEKTEKITSYGYVVKQSENTVLNASIKMAFKLFEANREVKKSLEVIQESEYRFRNLINKLKVGVLLYGLDYRVYLSNQAGLELLGLTEKELIGRTAFDPYWNFIHEDGTDFPASEHPVVVAIQSKKEVLGVIMGVSRPLFNDRIWLMVDAEPQFNSEGTVVNVICSFFDITKGTFVEKILEKSLLEKNLELKELHYRFKDNLNSLNRSIEIRVQNNLNNPCLLELTKIQNQVQSLMEVYNILDGLPLSESIDLNVYLTKLIDLYSDLMNLKEKGIQIHKKMDSILLDANRTHLIGILVNEVIANIDKYAFPPEKTWDKQINILLSGEGDKIKIQISDNGIGIPENKINSADSSGLKIVNRVIRQLKGKMNIDTSSGTSFTFLLRR